MEVSCYNCKCTAVNVHYFKFNGKEDYLCLKFCTLQHEEIWFKRRLCLFKKDNIADDDKNYDLYSLLLSFDGGKRSSIIRNLLANFHVVSFEKHLIEIISWN